MINTNNNELTGFLIINKPKNATSFRAIAQIRRILQNKKLKAGYAGTLDPFATGILIVGLGREATKALHTITRWDKQYVARAKLGEKTDTLDCTGEIVEWCSTEVTEHQLRAAIGRLGRQYTQTPPIYSALKHQGVPLYKLARHKKRTQEDLQEAVDDKARSVTLHTITLSECAHPWFTIEAHVSHGTYIRTLVNDIARNAHSCATTYELTRTAVGNVILKDAFDLDALQTPQDIKNNLISLETFKTRFSW
jgi:tRNA pseudouridine55 synthase